MPVIKAHYFINIITVKQQRSIKQNTVDILTLLHKTCMENQCKATKETNYKQRYVATVHLSEQWSYIHAS